MANDKAQECDHPPKPEAPYTDEDAGIYITNQGESIERCRALLGHNTGK